jgi:hypothetical protein
LYQTWAGHVWHLPAQSNRRVMEASLCSNTHPAYCCARRGVLTVVSLRRAAAPCEGRCRRLSELCAAPEGQDASKLSKDAQLMHESLGCACNCVQVLMQYIMPTHWCGQSRPCVPATAASPAALWVRWACALYLGLDCLPPGAQPPQHWSAGAHLPAPAPARNRARQCRGRKADRPRVACRCGTQEAC